MGRRRKKFGSRKCISHSRSSKTQATKDDGQHRISQVTKREGNARHHLLISTTAFPETKQAWTAALKMRTICYRERTKCDPHSSLSSFFKSLVAPMQTHSKTRETPFGAFLLVWNEPFCRIAAQSLHSYQFPHHGIAS